MGRILHGKRAARCELFAIFLTVNHTRMIEVRDVSYMYNESKAIRFPDLILNKAETCLLLGESGSGKTTYLHLLGGLRKSQAGHIIIDNTDITALSEHALDHFRGQHTGFIFQRNHLIRALSVSQNLTLASTLAGQTANIDHINMLLDTLGLADKQHASIQSLSQGQAQRVAIARAVVNKPTVIFADEPTSALDDTNCTRVINLLLDIAAKHQSTLLIATHDHRLKPHITKTLPLNAA